MCGCEEQPIGRDTLAHFHEHPRCSFWRKRLFVTRRGRSVLTKEREAGWAELGG